MATKKKKPLSNDEMVKRMANVLKDKEQVPNARKAFDNGLKAIVKKQHEPKQG
jgi:hypothetical protein